METIKIYSGCQELGTGMNREHRTFQGSGTPLYDAIMIICCLLLFTRSVVSDCLDPMDCSPLGSSVRETSQGRTLEWVAISSSRGSSQPRDRTLELASAAWQADS